MNSENSVVNSLEQGSSVSSGWQETGKCIIVGDNLIGLQASLLLRSIGVQVVWVGLPRDGLCATYLSGSVVWESSSRTEWNYLGLLKPFLDLWNSPEIAEFSKNTADNEMKLGWIASSHILLPSENFRAGSDLPNQDHGHDPDFAELVMRLRTVSSEMNRWTKGWLEQLGWQSEQAANARERREKRALLRRARIERERGAHTNSGESLSVPGRSRSETGIDGWRSEAKILLIDYSKQLAAALEAFRRSGDRREPKTAQKRVLTGVMRKTGSRRLLLGRNLVAGAWKDNTPSSQLEHRQLDLREGLLRYKSLVAFDQCQPDSLSEVQVAETLEGLCGFPELGGLSPYWKTGLLSEQRRGALQNLAKQAGIEFIEACESFGEGDNGASFDVLRAKGGEFCGIRMRDPKLGTRDLLGDQLVITDLGHGRLFTDSGHMQKRSRPKSEDAKTEKVCTLALDFGMLELPSLPRVRCIVGGTSAEIEWYARSPDFKQALGTTLFVRFVLPASYDGNPEACRQMAIETLTLLKAEFPGQFANPHTVFPNVFESEQWTSDCEKIGGTPVRIRRTESFGGAVKELRAKGIPAVELSPWTHKELGPWGGVIGLVELAVGWSQRLCVPWHRT